MVDLFANPILDGPIDLFRDGVTATVHKLVCRAHGRDDLEGDVDLPAHGGVSHVALNTGDFHVEFTNVVEDDDLCDDLAYSTRMTVPTRAPEQGPADTDPPFIHPYGNREAPGVLGKAMKAFNTVCVTMEAFGRETQDYEDWFQDTWGLDDECMQEIRYARPKTRSSGPTLLAGLGKNLAPAVVTDTGAAPGIRVVHHGVQRTKFGEDAIVDWARVTAIGKAMALGTYCDDDTSRGKVKRLDFSVVPQNVPRAAKKFYIPPIAKRGLNTVTGFGLGLKEFLKSCRRRAETLFKATPGETVECEVMLNPPVRAFAALRPLTQNPFGFTRFAGDGVDGDVELRTRHEAPPRDVIRKAQPADVVRDLILSKIQRITPPRAHALWALISALDKDVVPKDVFQEGADMVSKLIPITVLIYVVSMGNLVKPHHGSAWLADVLADLDAPRGIMQSQNLLNIHAQLMRLPKYLVWVLKAALRAVTEFDQKVLPGPTFKLYRALLDSAQVDKFLNDYFTRRKRYWAHRYYRTAKGYGDCVQRVEYQLRSKVFKNLKVRVDRNGSVSLNVESVAASLCASANNYVRKRENRDPGYVFTAEQIRKSDLDEAVAARVGKAPMVPYRAALADAEYRASEFVDDVREYLHKLLVGADVQETDLPDESDTDEDDSDDDTQDRISPLPPVAQLAEVVPNAPPLIVAFDDYQDPEPAPHEELGVMCDDDFAEAEPLPDAPVMCDDEFEDVEDNPNVGAAVDEDDFGDEFEAPAHGRHDMVDLIDEISEICGKPGVDDQVWLVATYGNEVLVDDFNQILAEYQERYRSRMLNHAASRAPDASADVDL